MKPKHHHLASFIAASLLGAAALAPAAVIITEDFSYSDGALNGQSGGTGFSGTWNSTTDVSGGVSIGNAASTRTLAAAFTSSGTLWVTFDWGYAGKPSENGSFGGLTFFAGGGERFLIGNTWPGTGHDLWRMNDSGPTMDLNYPDMKTAVAKITLGAGASSTVELWVGPTGTPVNVSGAAMATATGRNLEGVDTLRIGGVDFGYNNPQSFDNLIIGTTMQDVGAIPEPAATLLGALGILCLLRRKR